MGSKNAPLTEAQNFKKNFKNFFIIYVIFDVFFILFDVVMTVDVILYSGTFPTDMIAFFSIYYLISAVYIGFTFKLIKRPKALRMRDNIH